MVTLLGSAFFSISVLLSGVSPVSELSSATHQDERIYGGESVATCAWPTTVGIQGCTATLVHPELLITAAHCITLSGQSNFTAHFGESEGGAARTTSAQCTTLPEYNGMSEGTDIAYCKLGQAQEDIPLVPILMGCDEDVLVKDREVYIVGFGNNDTGHPQRTKLQAKTIFNNFTINDGAHVGGGGIDTCQGDSGGPVYVQMDDGSWRVFGITSWGPDCGSGTYYGVMSRNVGWIEESSGIDITPCHDADGTWNPGPDCGEVPADIVGAVNGDWSSGCADGPTLPHRECGAPDGEIGEGGETGEEDTGETGETDTGETGEEDTGGTEEDSGEEDSGEEGTGTGTTGDEEGGTEGDDEGDDESGCGCRSSNTGGSAPTALGLMALFLFLRRRR